MLLKGFPQKTSMCSFAVPVARTFKRRAEHRSVGVLE
jgi:hypothetical protein